MPPISPRDALSLERCGEPVVSPDGLWLVAPVGWDDIEANRSFSRLCIFDANGAAQPRALTQGAVNDDSPAWSPDGRRIAFVSRRENKPGQIFVIDPAGGEAVQLTDVARGALAPKWAPGGDALYFLAWRPGAPTRGAGMPPLPAPETPLSSALMFDDGPVAYWDRYLDAWTLGLFALDVATKAVKPLLPDDCAVEFRTPASLAFAVSPDGDEIAFVAVMRAEGAPSTDILALTLRDGALRNLSGGESRWDQAPTYSPDGRRLAWLANKRAYAIDRCSPGGELIMLRDRPPAGPTPSDGAPRRLAADWDTHPRALVWSPDSAALYCVAEDRPTRRVFRVPLSGETPAAITGGSDFAGLAPHGARLFALRMSHAEPPTLVEIDAATRRQRKLSAINDAALGAYAMGAVESVTYAGADGEDVQMWVTKPPGFDPARKYPVLVLLHGGPFFGVTDAWSARWSMQVFAGWGYVVAFPNFHGSSGFGDAFAGSIHHERARKPYDDIIAAAAWFVRQPWCDSRRMAAAGGSFGGFLACTLLGRPHPFKTLIAHAAVYDQYAQEGADYAYATNDLSFESHAHLQANSPHMLSDNFNTPTLITTGVRDLRVPASQSLALFHALRRRGVPARLVLYPDENHHILLPQNTLNWYEQLKAWLEHYAPAGARD